MEEKRKNIKKIIEGLEDLSQSHFYKDFEIALVIYLRGNLFLLDNYINDGDIKEIEDKIEKYSSLMDTDLKDKIDNIIYRVEE